MIDKVRNLYKRALTSWGRAKQLYMYFEENAELQVEVAKYERYRERLEEKNNFGTKDAQLAKIADEIADAQIMIEQLQVIYDVEEETKRRYDHKIYNLEHRLNRLKTKTK